MPTGSGVAHSPFSFHFVIKILVVTSSPGFMIYQKIRLLNTQTTLFFLVKTLTRCSLVNTLSNNAGFFKMFLPFQIKNAASGLG